MPGRSSASVLAIVLGSGLAVAAGQEGNANVVIGGQNYFRRTDGVLMPAKKDQPPPDLRYFRE